MPQKAIPRILEHPNYSGYLHSRKQRYEKLSQIAYDGLKDIPGVLVNRTNGAFYMCVVFEKNLLNHRQTLPIADPQVRNLVEELTRENIEPDKRFVYYLLAASSICVVPLTSFSTDLQGLRFTLLEQDEAKFHTMIETLSLNIRDYLKS